MQYFILFYLLLFSVPTFACECSTIENLSEAQRQEFAKSDMIFVREVIRTNTNSGTYQLKVVELFKGNSKKKIVTGKEMNSCSLFPAREGELWLVYASVLADGTIHISDCGLSRSYRFPYAFNDEIEVPAPPRTDLKDRAIDELDLEIANSEHHQNYFQKLLYLQIQTSL